MGRHKVSDGQAGLRFGAHKQPLLRSRKISVIRLSVIFCGENSFQSIALRHAHMLWHPSDLVNDSKAVLSPHPRPFVRWRSKSAKTGAMFGMKFSRGKSLMYDPLPFMGDALKCFYCCGCFYTNTPGEIGAHGK
jgi:hypothetical protein